MKHALLLLGFILILLGLYLGFTTFRVVGIYQEFGVPMPVATYALPLVTVGLGALLFVVYALKRLAEKIVIFVVVIGAVFLFGLLSYFLISGYMGGKQVDKVMNESLVLPEP